LTDDARPLDCPEEGAEAAEEPGMGVKPNDFNSEAGLGIFIGSS
jgi:hypothetical protein